MLLSCNQIYCKKGLRLKLNPFDDISLNTFEVGVAKDHKYLVLIVALDKQGLEEVKTILRNPLIIFVNRYIICSLNKYFNWKSPKYPIILKVYHVHEIVHQYNTI